MDGLDGVNAGESTWVPAIGWFWVCASVVKVVGINGYLWLLSSDDGLASLSDPGMTAGPAWLLVAAAVLSRHLAAFAAGWTALGIFMLVAGVSLLRRRPWARFGLEAICWFGVVEAPTVMAFLLGVRMALQDASLPSASRLAPLLLRGVAFCVAWFLVYVLSLVLLRGRLVRA